MDAQTTWLLFRPTNVFVLGLLVGLVLSLLGYRRPGFVLIGLISLTLAVVGTLPIADALLRNLENRVPRPERPPSQITGILLLGGVTSPMLSKRRRALDLNASGDRLVEVAALSRQFPTARIWLLGKGEASSTSRTLMALGIPADRLRFEKESRNTYQNLAFAKLLARPDCVQNWVLVTSAWHMPRAISVAWALDWRVIGFPTDYRTLKKHSKWFDPNVAQNLMNFDVAIKEWIGILVYRMRGWINDIPPSRHRDQPCGLAMTQEHAPWRTG